MEQRTAKNFAESDRQYIDAFSVLKPYEPVVFDSLMQPIAEEWAERSKSADGREDLAVAASPIAAGVHPDGTGRSQGRCRGWFTASLLGQLDLHDQRASTIFVANSVGGDGQWLPFPSPLLASGVTASHDYLPLALESLPLAFIDVSMEARLTPVLPYKRLRELGTSGSGGLESYESLNAELVQWIEDGQTPQGAPTPKSEHAGESGQDDVNEKELLTLASSACRACTTRFLPSRNAGRSNLSTERTSFGPTLKVR